MNKLLLGLFLLSGVACAGLADNILAEAGRSDYENIDRLVVRAAKNAEEYGFDQVKDPTEEGIECDADLVTFGEVDEILTKSTVLMKKVYPHGQADEEIDKLKSFQSKLRKVVASKRRTHKMTLRKRK